MAMTLARSARSAVALDLVRDLQNHFRDGLEACCETYAEPQSFTRVEWLRDEGRHGGGVRYEIGDAGIFNRASINVSQVHYDDEPARRLLSATALSTIIHPFHPLAPSVHIHISWTEMKAGLGYWRMMADLNPAIPDERDAAAFSAALRRAAGDLYESARAQGDTYFHIPALGRSRGISHFYIEGHSTADFSDDRELAERIGTAAIDGYLSILRGASANAGEPTDEQRRRQLEYHTLYLFQVLTLDRGTTSGLLIHDQNDLGILGSLPARVDRELLASWIDRTPELQRELVARLVAILADDVVPAPVTGEAKLAMAQALREHYARHPEALELQAAGDVIPPTVGNHR